MLCVYVVNMCSFIRKMNTNLHDMMYTSGRIPGSSSSTFQEFNKNSFMIYIFQGMSRYEFCILKYTEKLVCIWKIYSQLTNNSKKEYYTIFL